MRYLAAGIALVCSFSSSACPTLEGTWSSSKETFIRFNQRWANIDDNAWQFMLQNQGLETIEYSSQGEMRVHTPEMTITMGEKTITREATEERSAFSVLGCTANSIVIAYTRYGKKHLSHLQFEGPNEYWEYVGQPGQSGNGHIREFFVRAQ